MGNSRHCWPKPFNGIESARQQGERLDDKVGGRSGMIELVGPYAGENAEHRQQDRTHGAKIEHQQRILHRHVHARCHRHHHPHRQPHQPGTRDRTAHPGQHQFPCRQRRHQHIDDRALHLGHQDGRRGVGKAVLDHAHHDQARAEEIGIRHPKDQNIAAAECHGKDHQEHQRGDRRRPDRLQLHLEKAPYLFQIKGLQPFRVEPCNHGHPGLWVCWQLVISVHHR